MKANESTQVYGDPAPHPVVGAPSGQGLRRRGRRSVRPLDQVKLDGLWLDQLREALRANLISFPTPVPTFDRHDRPDLQWRLVQLYFVLGWSCESIAARYGLTEQRIGQILKTWKRRAIEMGYIQCIPPLESLRIGEEKQRIQESPWPPFVGFPSQPLPPSADSNTVSDSARTT